MPYYVQCFGSNIVEGVAESWVESKMNWVEVDGAGWRWVHDLVMPILKYCQIKPLQRVWMQVYFQVLSEPGVLKESFVGVFGE